MLERSSPASDRQPRKLYVLRPTMGQGGADRVTLTLLRALDRSLFAPSLLLMRREGALLPEVPRDVAIRPLGSGRLWTGWWPLFRLLKREPPEILFSTSSGANLLASLATLLAGGRFRLVLSERSMLLRADRPLTRRILLLGKRLLYPRADSILAVSRGVADDLAARLGLGRKVRVVYNPVVTPELDRLAGESLDHSWLRGGGAPVILAVGRLIWIKGFDLLVRAFAGLRVEREARLLILGEGPERPLLEGLVRRLGLEESVSLPGFESNPYRYMARCTLFVLSSRVEGLPGALIQAMACGAPVVATACPTGPAEIIRHGETGLLVPIDDEAALRAGIGSLLDQPERRRRLARAGRLSVQRFTVDRVLGAYSEALLGPRNRPPSATSWRP